MRASSPRFQYITRMPFGPSQKSNVRLYARLLRQCLGLWGSLLATCASAQLNYVSSEIITTFAGSAPTGSADGIGSAAQFSQPAGVAVDSNGNVYVADIDNDEIRKISSAGVVTTIAGGGTSGSADGTGSAARFNGPFGLAVDGTGNIYVADTYSSAIRKITPTVVSGVTTWEVSTLAGTAGLSGSTDGTGSSALFSSPCGVGVDASGNVYVGDAGNNTIRKITPTVVGGVTTWAVTTIAGAAGQSGSADGTGDTARFDQPYGVTLDRAGNIYVADALNNTIRKITPTVVNGDTTWVVTTLAGAAGQAGFSDGTRSAALFNQPFGVAVDGEGNVYVADHYNNAVREITPAGVVATVAGGDGGEYGGYADGVGSAAGFWSNEGVAVDSAGNVYVADTGNSRIRMITPTELSGVTNWVVTTLAGAASRGVADGTGDAAQFNVPFGVSVDGVGNVYVADSDNSIIRRITPLGVVTTIAGAAGQFGSVDGTGSSARFEFPSGVAVDGAGNIYVADTNNSTIREITPVVVSGVTTWVVTTLAGSARQNGSADGTGSSALFSFPSGVAVDASGNIYVADTNNSTIRKLTPTVAGGVMTWVVTTLAGSAHRIGRIDGLGASAQFEYPAGLAVDSLGSVYVADGGNNMIRKITPTVAGGVTTWVVTTLAGSGQTGYLDGTGSAADFNHPNGVAVDSKGIVYVADTLGLDIREITPTLVGGVTNWVVTTLAGSGYGDADGIGSNALFNQPQGVAVNSTDDIFVADTLNNTIRKGSLPKGPSITVQPSSQTVLVGGQASFAVSATGAPAPTYQWKVSTNGGATFTSLTDGSGIAGSTMPTLTLTDIAVGSSGNEYECVITNELLSVTTAPVALTVNIFPSITIQPVSQTANTGSDVVFTVVVSGASTVGYQWQFNGVNLSDGGVISGSNGPQLFIQGVSGANEGEFACIVTVAGNLLQSNSASLTVTDSSTAGFLVNISSRAFVGTGNNILIGGFYIGGSTARSVLIQALGPALQSEGVTGVLQHPALTIHNSSGAVIYSNTGWGTNPVLLKAAASAYAQPILQPDSADSEVLLTLPPGGYTAEVSGADGGTGLALCAIYQLP